MYFVRFESSPPDNCWELAKDTPVTDNVVECPDRNMVGQAPVKVFDLPEIPVSDGCGSH